MGFQTKWTAGPSPLRNAWGPYSSESGAPPSTEYRATTKEQKTRARSPFLAEPTLQLSVEGTANVQFHVPEQDSSTAHIGFRSNDNDGNNLAQSSHLKAIFHTPTRRSSIDHAAPVSVPITQPQFSDSAISASLPALPPPLATFSTNATPPHPALLNPFPPDGTQFFILDSSGNDPSGLATYTALPPYPDSLTVNPSTGERMYYLTPAATIFRVSESRLTPVGYRNGDVVKQKGNFVSARILRRYVVGRERRYDLRDELGGVWRGVGEGELEGRLWENLKAESIHDGMNCGRAAREGQCLPGNEAQVDVESLEGLDLEEKGSWDKGEMDMEDLEDGGGREARTAFVEKQENNNGFGDVEMQLG